MRLAKLFIPVIGVLTACSTTPPDITDAERAALASPTAEVQAEVARLLPAGRRFVDTVEATALREGRPLSEAEIKIAVNMGIRQPERVRIHSVSSMPVPADPALQPYLNVSGTPLGFTSGYGITLRRSPQPEWLVAHELAHVAQFERIGRDAMVRRYLTERMLLPHTLIPIEREAIDLAAEATGTHGGASGYAY